MKRSHIITITLSSLPPPHLLPPAIYSMDTTVLDREDLQVWKPERFKASFITNDPADSVFPSPSLQKQRLQVIMPTDEELCLIKAAQTQNPHSPLAPAELCLLTLGQISSLSSRLQLWAFALDYDALERVCRCTTTTTSQIYINAGFGSLRVASMCSGCISAFSGYCRASLSSQVGHGAAFCQSNLPIHPGNSASHRKLS